jgi:hypothetical protein
MRRGGFEVDDIEGARFDLALERLRSGHTFEFEGITFRFEEGDTLVCEVCSSWASEYVTSATASADLERCRSVLRYLLDASDSFSSSVVGHRVRYDLIEDYGTGSILLRSEPGDFLKSDG